MLIEHVKINGKLEEIDLDEYANKNIKRPSRAEAEAAVKTLIAWAGDNPEREGLLETPSRVVKSYEEFFAGYDQNAEKYLSRTFEDVDGYEDIVMLKNIPFDSHCEHHIVPIKGVAHVAYLPNDKVVGLSKLARVVDMFASRLQTQETMTAQIARSIQDVLKPRGVAVYIEATHECIAKRGVKKSDVITVTQTMTGEFKTDEKMEQRFLKLLEIK